MSKAYDGQTRVIQARDKMMRTWLMWGMLPLVASALLTFTISVAWAKPLQGVDVHNIERGFQAVLAICASLFLAGFWLDGKWTNSERIAQRIWKAAGGGQFSPTRAQLAAHSDIAFKTIGSSVNALTFMGAAMAVAAVVAVWAGLGIAEGAQVLLLGLAYQFFVFSRQPYYEEVLEAASRGELVVAEEDANHPNTK